MIIITKDIKKNRHAWCEEWIAKRAYMFRTKSFIGKICIISSKSVCGGSVKS